MLRQIYMNKEKLHLKIFFVGIRVIHWIQNLSLRYSLWKRDPTNDISVVRFCLSVPEEQYVQNGLDRALIRRSTEEILPDKLD